MKGERNRIRALKAKIIYGEGTERRTAQRVLDQLEKDSDSKGYLPLLVQNEKSIIEQGR